MALLSLALLPLGLVALAQTRSFQAVAEERSGLSLLALTARGADGVRSAIEQSLGAGEALRVDIALGSEGRACSDYLAAFVEAGGIYAFAGLLPRDGRVTCASQGAPFVIEDPEDLALLAEPLLSPRVRGSVFGEGAEAREMLVVAIPLSGPAAAAAPLSPGYLALAIPQHLIRETASPEGAPRPLGLVTFNDLGEILTDGVGLGEAGGVAPLLPAGEGLAGLAEGEARVFEAADATGARRVYTVAPLVPGVAYALGVWTPAQAGIATGILGWPFLFPLLMWLASLLVAFWAIHNLVVARVGALAATMRRFGGDRTLPQDPPPPDAAYELRAIEQAFRDMAHAILQDEARMEDAYRERGVLLREVHHRVKNNLQLISSIISMQVRRLPEPEARLALKRLQDRVLTLAAIYRTLYTSADMGAVNVAPILRAVAAQELQPRGDAIEAELRIDDLVLDADRAVPLAFLAAEAVSNAAAHARAPGGRPRVEVALVCAQGTATLTVSNAAEGPPPRPRGQGLGRHLIQAFAAQIGSPVETAEEGGVHRLSVSLPVEPDACDPA
jgi:two-component sensor histidine kinase